MSNAKRHTGLVLGIALNTRGFGYGLFESPQVPVDWGTKAVRGDKNRKSVKRFRELIEQFRPDVLVIEDPTAPSSRRHPRIKVLTSKIVELALENDITVKLLPRTKVLKHFEPFGATTKYKIAVKICALFPELEPILPRPRKMWEAENPRLSIFDAIALIVLFYAAKR
jgi:hypothetical protein